MMPKYLIQASYTPEGLQGALSEGFQSRMETVTGMIAGAGGTVEALYFTYGEHDVVGIVDGPEESAIALSLAVNASGAVELSTTPLISIEQMDVARGQLPDFRAPGT
jgi:uncharacterized protein with GYD domain